LAFELPANHQPWIIRKTCACYCG